MDTYTNTIKSIFHSYTYIHALIHSFIIHINTLHTRSIIHTHIDPCIHMHTLFHAYTFIQSFIHTSAFIQLRVSLIRTHIHEYNPHTSIHSNKHCFIRLDTFGYTYAYVHFYTFIHTRI